MSPIQRSQLGKSRWARPVGIVTLVVLIATGTAWAAYAFLLSKPVLRFAAVVPGVLYRSGQPDQSGWQFLKDTCGIRTVIDLRENGLNEPWAVLEREFCARNGIRHIKVAVGHEGLTDEQLRTVVETISDPQCQPVLVHCKLGRSRTGVTVAAYRIVGEGWSYEAALADSQRYKSHMNPPFMAYLKRLSQGEGWRPAPQAPLGRSLP